VINLCYHYRARPVCKFVFYDRGSGHYTVTITENQFNRFWSKIFNEKCIKWFFLTAKCIDFHALHVCLFVPTVYLFVCLYQLPKLFWLISGPYKLKETSGWKRYHLVACIHSSNLNPLNRLYGLEKFNGGCNFDASVRKSNRSAKGFKCRWKKNAMPIRHIFISLKLKMKK
jgi:hypothetical protein